MFSLTMHLPNNGRQPPDTPRSCVGSPMLVACGMERGNLARYLVITGVSERHWICHNCVRSADSVDRSFSFPAGGKGITAISRNLQDRITALRL
jgi:hypothetical protein